MPHRVALAIATAALLLPLVAAQGDELMDMSDMSANVAPQPQPQDDGQPRSYWSLSEHATLMYWHIGLEILAWVVILPIAVMLSIARSRFTLPSQLAFLATNALALVLGFTYNHQTPELYENNSHGKTGWIITWIASAWVFMWVIQMYTGLDRMTVANMTRYQRVHGKVPDQPRYSDDSGQGTERNTSSLLGRSRSPSVESEEQQFIGQRRLDTQADGESFDDSFEKRSLLRNTSIDRFFSRNVARFAVGRTLEVIRFFYVVFERTLLIQGFVAVVTGTVVLGGIARGEGVFNVLAHFIKGGIVVHYGLLTLGRWAGAFADFGWAWNVKPPGEVVGRRRAALQSAEFTESFFIWLIGACSVFLEHLAAWGEEWTAQDLEHAAINLMFFGGGLLGMVVESKRMRGLLNSAVVSMSSNSRDDSWKEPRQYRFSMNPLPALLIMIVGKMMSSHHQSSMLSTMIHGQWGGMFMGFGLARGLTYITLYVSPPSSFLPSRPPTEIVASFCLIAGGITLMVSNKDTVASLEQYGLDAMFIFTLTMGLTALLMAWTTVVIALKGWALRKENRSECVKSCAVALA